MKNIRIGLEVHKDLRLPTEEQVRVFKKCGFDAFFAYWQRGMDVASLKRCADEEGMFFHSLHAPSTRVCDMWYQTENTEDVLNELTECLQAAKENGIPLVVSHAFCGFDRHEPTEMGIRNFERLIEEAEKLNLKIAFENTEGEEYLAALINHFEKNENVGFCWDTGHELCYTHRDLMAEHGRKIFSTHLNDNLGTYSKTGERTGRDDLHLLPFDGIADWSDIVQRLNKWNYNDILMFELKTKSQPGRHENDVYSNMDPEEYLKLAYERCRKVAEMKLKGANVI